MRDEAIFAGESIYLRQVRLEDAALLTRWKTDPVIQQMALGPEVEVSLNNQEQDITSALSDDEQLYLIIVRKEDDHPIGYIRINWMDNRQQHAWLRFALGEERGKGYTGEAIATLLEDLFARGLHRAEAEVYAFNHVSLKLLSSLGFQQEGIKRQAHFNGEGYCDVVVLGLLSEDWLRRKK